MLTTGFPAAEVPFVGAVPVLCADAGMQTDPGLLMALFQERLGALADRTAAVQQAAIQSLEDKYEARILRPQELLAAHVDGQGAVAAGLAGAVALGHGTPRSVATAPGAAPRFHLAFNGVKVRHRVYAAFPLRAVARARRRGGTVLDLIDRLGS